MKAIDKLIKLRKTDSSIVAICMDSDKEVFLFRNEIPEPLFTCWHSNIEIFPQRCLENIEFDSDNWKECIVTVDDIENYEVKMISISVQEYERLIQAEKTLQNIQNIISKR